MYLKASCGTKRLRSTQPKTSLSSDSTNPHATASRLFTGSNMVRFSPASLYTIDSCATAFAAEKQTVQYNIQARVDFKTKIRARMGIWEAMEMLNTLVDESDPDVSGFFFYLTCGIS